MAMYPRTVTASHGYNHLDLAACETTLAMHLHGQLNVMAMTPRDLCMARAIVESLDDDGYLRTDLQELAGLLALSPAPDAQEMLIALRLVQSLDPAGVAARSVGECLLLQCPQIGDARLRQLAQAMVQDHMDALAARDVPRLARALQVPPAQITQALDCIRRLNPRTGWNFGSSNFGLARSLSPCVHVVVAANATGRGASCRRRRRRWASGPNAATL